MTPITEAIKRADDELAATGVDIREGTGDASIVVGNQTFNVETFHAQVKAAVLDKCVGYVLWTSTETLPAFGSGAGFTRTPADRPPVSWYFTRRADIVSVTQTLTAAAVVKLLAEKQVDLDARLSAYLPSDWTLGPNVAGLTFKALLTHTSGIRGHSANDVDYEYLRTMVARGTSPDKSFTFQAQNFALFRVLIPALRGFKHDGVSDVPAALAAAYLRYMNEALFAPIGIATVHARSTSAAPPLTYPFPAPNAHGTDLGDATLLTGGTGLHLSMDEMRLFLRRLRFTDQILSAAQRRLMDEQQLGWFRKPVINGSVFQQNGMSSVSTTAGIASQHAYLADFSIGVQVVMIHNSPLVPATAGDLVLDAYNAAWE